MKHIKLFLTPLFLFLLFSLVACGGGSSSNSPPPAVTNQKPTVSANDITANEASTGTLSATATDPDGSIISYFWSQKSGVSINLLTSDTSSVSFDTPTVKQDSVAVFTVVVTDNSGATASTDVNVNILSNRVTLSLQGIISDDPVPEAKILVELDDQSFTSVADTSGNYQIDLDIDDFYLNKVVNITAAGSQLNSQIKLKSILGSLSSLLTAAGTDKILTGDEMFAVNVTNISSSFAVVMEDVNFGNKIVDVSEYEKALNSYDPDNVFSLALIQKIIQDYSSQNVDLSLPSQFATIFDLLKDKKVAGQFLNNATQKYRLTVDAARLAIFNDVSVISTGTNTIPVVDSYYFKGSSGIGRLVLNNDGSGLVTLRDQVTITWKKNSSGLELNYPIGGSVESTRNLGATIIEILSIKKSLKWLQNTEKSDYFMIESTFIDHYTDGSQPDSDPYTKITFQQAIKSKGVLDAREVLTMDSAYSIPIPSVINFINNPRATPFAFPGTYSYNAAKVVFSGDVNNGGLASYTVPVVGGDGVVTELITSLNWTIDDDGHVILSGDLNFDLAFLSDLTGKISSVNVVQTINGVKNFISRYLLKKESISWSTQTASGVYVLPAIFTGPLNLFWLEINKDGTAFTVSTEDRNNDGIISDNEFTSFSQGLWQIDSTGKLIVRRYRSNTMVGGSGNYCISLEFSPPDDADCVIYNQRELDLFQVTQDNKYYVTNIHKFYEDAFRALISGAPPAGNILQLYLLDNRYWEKLDASPVPIPAALITNARNKEQALIKISPNISN